MKLPTKTLKKLIANTTHVLDGKSPVQVLNCINIIVIDNSITIKSTNCDIWVTEKYILDQTDMLNEAFNVMVDGKSLQAALNTIKGDEVSLTFDETLVHLRSGRQRFRLNTVVDLHPSIETVNSSSTVLTCSSDELHNVLKRVSFAMGNDDSRPYCRGVNFGVHDELVLSSADGNRLAQSKVPLELKNGTDGEFLVPDVTVRLLNKVLKCDTDVEVKMCFSNNVAAFCFNGTEIVSKLTDSAFPIVANNILKDSYPFEIKVCAEEMKTACETALALCHSDVYNAAILTFDGGFKIVAKGTNASDTDYDVDCEFLSQPADGLRIGINVKNLASGINVFDGDLTIGFDDATKPYGVRSDDMKTAFTVVKV